MSGMTDPIAKPASTDVAESDRQVATARPPFDPAEYARESESNIAVEAEVPMSARPTAPPPPGLPQYDRGLTSGTMQSVSLLTSDAIPTLAVAREDLEWFDLTPPVRRLLALVDGLTPIHALSELAGLPVDEATTACRDLARDGILHLATETVERSTNGP
jgi:hypothetical protein